MRFRLPSLTSTTLFHLLLAVVLVCCPMLQTQSRVKAANSPSPTLPAEEHEENNSKRAPAENLHEEATVNRSERRIPSQANRDHAHRTLTQRLLTHPRLALLRSTDSDPFHNGLGSPFLC